MANQPAGRLDMAAAGPGYQRSSSGTACGRPCQGERQGPSWGPGGMNPSRVGPSYERQGPSYERWGPSYTRQGPSYTRQGPS